MHTQAEIERSIRSALPITFGKVGSVDDEVFGKKHEALVSSAAAATEPFLKGETVRYQSILMASSLFLIALNFFRFGDVKLFDKVVRVDAQFKLMYTIFIVAMSAIFLIKAYVDTQRAAFVRSSSDRSVTDLKALLKVGIFKKRIQDYFWRETFDLIGQTYAAYYEAQTKAIGNAQAFKHTPINILAVDLDAMRAVPDLAAEITTQEGNLAKLTTDLSGDEARFKVDADAILIIAQNNRKSPQGRLQDTSYQDLEAAYAQHLKPWFDARNALGDTYLDVTLNEMSGSLDSRRLNGMVSVLRRTRTIRRVYVALEIIIPVLFAVVAIFYCWRG